MSPASNNGRTPIQSVVIGTAGHIDHGKTTLIRRLTGVDTDRLPEEKRRGITVDLGFASISAEIPDISPVQLSFIDVPGHALFVRNMLAGAGGIDAVMLVISAEEGVKPQTEEHLAICTMLGIERGITVITKTDAVTESWLNEVQRNVRRFLAGTFLSGENAAILPVSARTGVGIEILRRELALLASRIPVRDRGALSRVPVDRVFVMKGFGTVVTGTMIAGSLQSGQTVAIEPGPRTVRVRGLQIHGKPTQSAFAGSRVALNLAGIDASDVSRGDTIVEASTITAVDTIDVEFDLLPHATPLKHRSRVHFHAFAAESMATVALYAYQAVEPGKRRLARLRLSKPIVLLPGDRFVIRHGTPVSTVGGGRVLDAHPLPRLRKGKCQDWLNQIKAASRQDQIKLRVARRNIRGLTIRDLSRETGIKQDTLLPLLEPLITSQRLVCIAGNLLLTCEAIDEAAALTNRIIFESLGLHRLSAGLKRSELKSSVGLNVEILEYVLTRLEYEKRIRVQGELVYTFDSDKLDADPDRASRIAIMLAYKNAGLAAPSPDELATTMGMTSAKMRRLITSLLRERTLVRLGSDTLLVHARALEDLIQKVRVLRGQKIDVARFKELTGLSRKYAIPLLEYLDRERVTRKQDDDRIVL